MRHLILFIILFASSCSNPAVQEELTKAKAELQAAQQTIQDLQAQIEPEGPLVHLVFFKLQPDADPKTLLQEIKKLEAIEEVMDLEAGPFEDLGDARALSEYSILMQMSFASASAYQAYQKHPIHLALRESVKPLMAGPPATYDFMKK